ncbi:unnamed protein product [Knipowitschia caucasica]
MEALSAALLLVLFTLGNATPLTTVTQVPRTEEDVFREAVTDGFIVDHPLLIFQTTPAPNNQTTDQPQSTTEEAEEGSGGESSEGRAMGESPVGQSTIQPTFSPATATPGIVVMEITEITILLNEPEDPTEPSEAIGAAENLTLTDLLGWGYGEAADSTEDPSSTVVPSSTEITTTSVTPITSAADIDLFHLPEGSGESKEPLSNTTEAYIERRVKPRMLNEIPEFAKVAEREREPQWLQEEDPHLTNKGHVTPDWIIIVGFLMGLTALVIILAAIATREKWNGPHQFNQTLTPADQQKAIEMEEFIHREHPRENGMEEEYTVIPLHELPDNYA